ncbi:MAG: PhzF family phenazine biosynthesis protein [Acidobacteria bacterium]|nr:MAG: PhzF family phenazine biosynthesis protein [Acidobacteriota bacterium]MCL4286596.1 PhzF family phenazine biosynthesis protein [Thermoleophilia bacterium]GIK78583.1 MAG: thymidylate synthase [Actinomycetes bacterium]
MPAPPQVEVRVPHVFCGPDGGFGNPLGVVLDGASVPVGDRQALARHLGYSETVFVDDAAAGRIAIYTPEVEYPFAGHPTVGAAWLLREEGVPVDVLRPPAGEVPVRYDGELIWVAGHVEWCPTFDLIELASPTEIDEHPGIEEGDIYVWAWIDEAAGLIRARCFAPDAGIAEDEATGSSVLRLAAELGREIEVRQGEGSIIHARPLDDGTVEIGGRVVEGC